MPIIKPYIPSPTYFNQIEPFIGPGLIKVMIGQRRVGKSYILHQLIKQLT